MPAKTIDRPTSQVAFAGALFSLYPDLKPTRSLYIDFEGGFGNERILSLYWPRNAIVERFEWIWAPPGEAFPSIEQLADALDELNVRLDAVQWIVVFSGGWDHPDEADRFQAAFGDLLFPDVPWANLHRALRESRVTMRSIRESKRVVYTKRSKTHYSLEALEWEFNRVRPSNCRSADNVYGDGQAGEVRVLDLADRVLAGQASIAEQNQLVAYCEWDVRSMFEIARKCEKILR